MDVVTRQTRAYVPRENASGAQGRAASSKKQDGGCNGGMGWRVVLGGVGMEGDDRVVCGRSWGGEGMRLATRQGTGGRMRQGINWCSGRDGCHGGDRTKTRQLN